MVLLGGGCNYYFANSFMALPAAAAVTGRIVWKCDAQWEFKMNPRFRVGHVVPRNGTTLVGGTGTSSVDIRKLSRNSCHRRLI